MTPSAPFVSRFAPFVILRAVVTALVIGFAAASHAAESLPMLLSAPPAATGQPARAPEPNAAVTRQRIVRVDTGFLDPRSASTPPALALELFDGNVVALDRVRIESRAPGNYTWYGKVRGHPRNDVVLTVVDGYLAGSITAHDPDARAFAKYALASAPDGTVWLRQIDTAAFPPDHPPGSERREAPPEPRSQGADAPVADSGAQIDVMVVYTNDVVIGAGGAIGAQIQQAIDEANLAYANSNIMPRLRLVHIAQLNYNEFGDQGVDLDRLTNTSDGFMDNVHTLRDTYGADIVNLFVESGGACGIGWLNSTPATAFSVVNRPCAITNLSFAHELGHNFGARHDPFVDSANSPYPYGHGYTNPTPPFGWRTVMAYDNACVAVGASCTRVAQFSNPDVSYAGAPTGTAATHDNARVHDERAVTVANFRQAASVGAPIVTTVAATATSPTGATLNGLVTSNGATTTVTFQYGTTVGYGNVANAAQSPLAAGASGAAVSAAIANLACNTLYHYRVVGSSTAGTTSGADLTFTTGACGTAPPAVATALASSITAFFATLNGTASANGFSTTVTFEYGLTMAYGNTTAATQNPLAPGATGVPVTAGIDGLLCNTVYHYRARAAQRRRQRDRRRRAVHHRAVLDRAAVDHDDRGQRQSDHHRNPGHDHRVRDRHPPDRHRAPSATTACRYRRARPCRCWARARPRAPRCARSRRLRSARIRSTPCTAAMSATRRRPRRSCRWWSSIRCPSPSPSSPIRMGPSPCRARSLAGNTISNFQSERGHPARRHGRARRFGRADRLPRR